MFNTILIKRRPWWSPLGTAVPTNLSGGELAFNDVDQTLYYGLSTQSAAISSIAIAGPGAFVSRTLSQDVSGTKTFKDTTIFDDAVTINSTLDVSSSIEANSYTIDGTEVIDSSRNATFADINASGNLTVTGNLSVLGDVTSIETTTTVASAFSITNVGSGPALTVTQEGASDIATFYDDANTALIIKDGGNVGINTAAPNKTLTVNGEVSATGTVFASGGLEVGSGATSTLYVEDGKVGINTETPNEELTVVGTISATEDIFARHADFTGTLHVSGATTLGSTLYAANVATFASSVSAAGAVEFDSTLAVDGAATLNSTLYVAQNSTFFANVSGQAGVSSLIDFIIDGGTF